MELTVRQSVCLCVPFGPISPEWKPIDTSNLVEMLPSISELYIELYCDVRLCVRLFTDCLIVYILYYVYILMFRSSTYCTDVRLSIVSVLCLSMNYNGIVVY